MDNLKNIDYEIRLLSGDAIEFQNIFIKPLTLANIRDLGFSTFDYYLNISMLYKIDLDKENEYETLFDVFTSERFFDLFYGFLHVFLEFESIEYGMKTKSIYMSNKNKIGILNSSNLDDFFEVFRMCYGLERNKKEKDVFDLIAEEERKIEKIKNGDSEITIASMISAVACKHPSINLLNIWDCTIYQLKDMVRRLYQIESSNNINFGIYTGNIPAKDIKINDYNWCNTLK